MTTEDRNPADARFNKAARSAHEAKTGKTDRDAANENRPTQRRTSSDEGNIRVRGVHGSLRIVWIRNLGTSNGNFGV